MKELLTGTLSQPEHDSKVKLLMDNDLTFGPLFSAVLLISKEALEPSLWARDNLGGIFGDNVGESHCKSKLSRDNLCRETSRCLAEPSGSRERRACM